MKTLLELINTHPTVTATSMGDFAQRVGVSRASLYRWDTRMPSPEILRRVADTLEEPYARVLAAALRSPGHIDTADDLLAGLQVHLVNCADPYSRRSRTIAAYATDTEMHHLVDQGSNYRCDLEGQTVTIEARAPRLPIRYHASLNRDGASTGPGVTFRVNSHAAPIGPFIFPDLSDDELAATGAMQDPFIVESNGYVMRIETESFDESIAQTMLVRAAALLNDKIAPPGISFGDVENLPPYDGDLPALVHDGGPFNGVRTLKIAVQDLLSPEEITQAATAYRAAREENKAAAAVAAQFDDILEQPSYEENPTFTSTTTTHAIPGTPAP